MVVNVLKITSIFKNPVFIPGLNVFLTVHVGESPLLGDNDLLTSSELVTGTT